MTCLDRLKERLSDAVGDRAVEVLRIDREAGGGLGRLLRNLSGYLREEARARRTGVTPVKGVGTLPT